MTSDKVPSDIAYEQGETGSRCLWGFQIPESMPCIQWIKLGLAPDQKLGISSRLPPGYQDHHNAHPPYVSSTEDVVTDYLRTLREHTVKVLETKIGRAFAEIPLEFIITVPAVWPDKAKAATLSCAAKAGLGESSMIRIISEPEAAAIHSLHISNPHGLGVGDTVILCDAGGGTVDLITFSVVELEPTLRLKEAASGNGALCGSTFLNKRFECFLEKRLASSPGWGRDTLEEALHRFENVAKRSFSGNIDDEFYFPVPGIRDNAKARVRRGRLQVTGQEMKDLFLPIPQEIHDLVQGQMRTSRRKVKAIFLVGGFGQNPYLRNFLRGAFSPGTDVIAPVNGWTAVVRGALMKVLGEICYPEPTFLVESRVARKHYGIRVQESFIKGFHDEKRK